MEEEQQPNIGQHEDALVLLVRPLSDEPDTLQASGRARKCAMPRAGLRWVSFHERPHRRGIDKAFGMQCLDDLLSRRLGHLVLLSQRGD